jgi:uncharacterized protein YgfB (UPF0149 family)
MSFLHRGPLHSASTFSIMAPEILIFRKKQLIDNQKDLQRLAETLNTSQFNMTLSELSGMIFGYLCTDANPSFERFRVALAEELGWDNLIDEMQQTISLIFLQAHLQLVQCSEAEAEKLMLLFDEETNSLLAIQNAIVDWTRGFLYGVGIAKHHPGFIHDPQLYDLLSDLTQISQLPITIDPSESDKPSLEVMLIFLKQAALRIYAHASSLKKEADASH